MREKTMFSKRLVCLSVIGILITVAFTTQALGNWTTNGPYGMGINDIEIDQSALSNIQYVYAAGSGIGTGVYKSENGGKKFFKSSTGISPDDEILSLAISPQNHHYIYAGSVYNRLYFSNNCGETWQLIGSELPPDLSGGGGIQDILIDPVEPDVIYLGTFSSVNIPRRSLGQIYKSTDGGQTFSDISPNLETQVFRVTSLSMDAFDHNIIYAGLFGCAVSGGVWRSMNGGNTWIPNAEFEPETWIDSIKADPNVAGRVFAGGSEHGCYRSDDYGATWTLVLSLNEPYNSDIAIVRGFGPSVVFFGSCDSGLYRSPRNGDEGSWIQLNDGLPHDSLFSLSVKRELVLVGGLYRQNIYRSDNYGNRFSRVSYLFPNIDVHSVAAVGTSSNVYAGAYYDAGVFKSGNGGTSWLQTMLPTFRVREIAVHPTNPNIILVATWDILTSPAPPFDIYDVFRSEDGGDHFTRVLSSIPRIAEIVFDPMNSQLAYVALSGIGIPTGYPYIIKSTDGGVHWTVLDDITPGILPPGLTSNSLAINHGILYYGTTNGLFSSSNGIIWARAGLQGQNVKSVAINRNSGIIAGTAHGIYKSMNNGQDWVLLGLSQESITDVVCVYRNGINSEWVVTSNGLVYEHINDAWVSRNNGLNNLPVRELAVTTNNQLNRVTLHAATSGGVYEWTIV